MGGITSQEQRFHNELKLAIQKKLNSLKPPLMWMTAGGLSRYLLRINHFKNKFAAFTVSSLLIEQLLKEMEKVARYEIRRSALPSKKNLDVLWGSKLIVGERTVFPVEKQQIQDDFFADEHFILNDETKKCFISHSHKDVEDAVKIGKKLLTYNIYPWMAETDIKYNVSINYEIQQAIKSADYFLIYVTENAIKSVWTEKELGFAQGIKRMVVANSAGLESLIKNLSIAVPGHQEFFNNDAERLKLNDESVSIFLDLIKNELRENNNLGMIPPFENTEENGMNKYNLMMLDDYFSLYLNRQHN